MMERIVFMHVEDGMVTFEKENGDTIIYPICYVPEVYNEGCIINAIIHNDFIEFLEVDTDAMMQNELMISKKSMLRSRAKRSTNSN